LNSLDYFCNTIKTRPSSDEFRGVISKLINLPIISSEKNKFVLTPKDETGNDWKKTKKSLQNRIDKTQKEVI
jgi:hypothetical protein